MEYEQIMEQQELNQSVKKAADFLSETLKLTYYGILQNIYQMQDNYFKDGKG